LWGVEKNLDGFGGLLKEGCIVALGILAGIVFFGRISIRRARNFLMRWSGVEWRYRVFHFVF